MCTKRSDATTVWQKVPYTEMSPAHVVYAIDENLNTRKVYYSIGCSKRGRDSAVGIATRYMLNGPWIESWWGRDNLHLFRHTLGPTQPLKQCVLGLYRG